MNLSRAILVKFDQLAELKDGWDGEGSIAPNAKVIQLAKDTLSHLPYPHRDSVFVGASPDGGVDFEWSALGVYCTMDADLTYCHLNRSPPKPASPNDIEGETFSLEGVFNASVSIFVKLLAALEKSDQERNLRLPETRSLRK